jgi:hypothetical protein
MDTNSCHLALQVPTLDRQLAGQERNFPGLIVRVAIGVQFTSKRKSCCWAPHVKQLQQERDVGRDTVLRAVDILRNDIAYLIYRHSS